MQTPVHGTIEIRVADTQTEIDDTTSIVAVIQALVAMLTDRYGMRGWLVDLDDGRRVCLRWIAGKEGQHQGPTMAICRHFPPRNAAVSGTANPIPSFTPCEP